MKNKTEGQLLGMVLLAAVVPKEMLTEVVRFDIWESAWKAAHILGCVCLRHTAVLGQEGRQPHQRHHYPEDLTKENRRLPQGRGEE